MLDPFNCPSRKSTVPRPFQNRQPTDMTTACSRLLPLFTARSRHRAIFSWVGASCHSPYRKPCRTLCRLFHVLKPYRSPSQSSLIALNLTKSNLLKPKNISKYKKSSESIATARHRVRPSLSVLPNAHRLSLPGVNSDNSEVCGFFALNNEPKAQAVVVANEKPAGRMPAPRGGNELAKNQ